jgi:hypothetical protein
MKNVLRRGLINIALFIGPFVFADVQPEGHTQPQIASYSAPEGETQPQVAWYKIREENKFQMASYSVPEGETQAQIA